jgi:hypothetical protein
MPSAHMAGRNTLGSDPRRALFGRLSTADCGLREPTYVRDMTPMDMPRGQTPVSQQDIVGVRPGVSLRGDVLEMLDGHERRQAARLAGVEAARAGLEHRRGAGGNRASNGVLE